MICVVDLIEHRKLNRVCTSWEILEKPLNFRKQNPCLIKSSKNRILRNALRRSLKLFEKKLTLLRTAFCDLVTFSEKKFK